MRCQFAMPEYRMVAYRAPEKHILSPNEKQELLLIRCSLEPIPKAGNNEMVCAPFHVQCFLLAVCC